MLVEKLDLNFYKEISQDVRYKQFEKEKLKFLGRLSEKEKKLFDEYEMIESKIESVCYDIYFIKGFKLGVNAGMEFSEEKINLSEFTI